MTRPIRLGISTCPNDTFAFHGLMTRAVDWRGLEFEVDLLDIEQLNERLLAPASPAFDVGKVSFHAALSAAERIVVLPSGSALGFGVGPLLLSAPAGHAHTHARRTPSRPSTSAMGRRYRGECTPRSWCVAPAGLARGPNRSTMVRKPSSCRTTPALASAT
jgi:predicted solute-binding protein